MYLAIVIQLGIIYSIQSAAQTDGQACSSCCTAGIPGIPGNHGNSGAPGSIGIKGDHGLKGYHGVKGDHGLKGDMGNNGLDGLPGILGPIGPQGEDGLAGANGAKGERGEKGEQPTVTTNQNKSAFTAAFKTSPGRHAVSPMKYETIITNVGNHYNNETGKFVCEFPGIYIFQVRSVKAPGIDDVITRIMKNGQMKASIWAIGDGYNSASTMVVLDLVVGDQVWTQPYSTYDNNYYSDDTNAFCTFSGFLLYAP